MVIESPFDDLYNITTPGQRQDDSSSFSSQQQLTLYNHRLCDPQFFSQSTNESNMQFSGGVTIPGIYNVSSNLGQNHLQIASGVSPDYQRIRSNNALHHISQILMDDVDEKVSSHEGEAALQAAEKAFYDILEQVYPRSLDWSPLDNSGKAGEPGEGSRNYHKRPPKTSFTSDISSSHIMLSLSAPLSPYSDSRSLFLPYQPLASIGRASRFGFPSLKIRREAEDAKGFDKVVINLDDDKLSICRMTTTKAKKVVGRSKYAIFQVTDHMNNPYILDLDTREGRSTSGYQGRENYTITCEIRRNANFDRVLLCYGLDCFIETTRLRDMTTKEARKRYGLENPPKGQSKALAQQKLRGTRQLKKEVVDLRTLLIHCAQAVAANDRLLAGELIKKIRQHSSRDGDWCQRLAFYFVNGLEARLAGTGSQLYQKVMTKRGSDENMLKVYNFYLAVCPFQRSVYHFANQTIMEASVGKSSTVHIVDFGVCGGSGFQWPSLIQRFGEQQVPQRLRITGIIEAPRAGFSPLENIEWAGKLLADYANMYSVPFQYQGIYSRYEDIQIEDLDIEEDEVLIINCMFRMRNLGDETIAMDSARDRVLKMMRRMNPKVFIFGILNGSYSSPFFVTRFKELLFHYSSIFDMLDTNAPRDNEERKLLEGGMFGREILNIVACEGADRIERPETYQQWQARCLKAGFEQLPLDPAIIKSVLWMKKEFYHEHFVADEYNGWMLQGWKGRVLYALSKWKVNESCAC